MVKKYILSKAWKKFQKIVNNLVNNQKNQQNI